MNPIKSLIQELSRPAPSQGRVVRVDGASMVVMTSEGVIVSARQGLQSYAEGDTVAVAGGAVLGKLPEQGSLPVFIV